MVNRATIITRLFTADGLVSEVYNGDTDDEQSLVVGIIHQELAPLLLNAKENLFDLAKQLEDTGAVMDKVAIDQAMKLDEKLDILSARFAKVKNIAKEAAVETALAVSDIFTGDFWKLAP